MGWTSSDILVTVGNINLAVRTSVSIVSGIWGFWVSLSGGDPANLKPCSIFSQSADSGPLRKRASGW